MPNDYKILSLDGGGSWALIQAKALGSIFGNTTPGRTILKQFDLIAATSGGSLVAGALATDRTPEEIAQLFVSEETRRQMFVDRDFNWLVRLFKVGPRYLTDLKLPGIRAALSGGEISGDTPLSALKSADSEFPNFLISSFDYDRRRAAFLRSNMGSKARSDPNLDDTAPTLAEALHASSTAPVNYFDGPARFSTLGYTDRRFWDGAAAGYNNPTLAAVTEALANGIQPAQIKILSIGTANVLLPLADHNTCRTLRQAFEKPSLITDIRKMATSVLADPPDAATYMAFRILHGELKDGDPIRLIRMNPMIQPLANGKGWRPPAGLSSREFSRLVKLDMDAVDQGDVELIDRFCALWIKGEVPNQLIQAKDNLRDGIGHFHFNTARESARAIGLMDQRSLSTPAQTTESNNARQKIAIDAGRHDDQLGRMGFVRHLVDVLQHVECANGAVIGLEGEWGSGKTWILNHIDTVIKELSVEPRPLVLWFNPWMVSGTGELVEAFLTQLAAQFAARQNDSAFADGAALAETLIDYTRVFSTAKHLAPLANLLVPGSGTLLEAVGLAASEAADTAHAATGQIFDRWKKAPEKLSLIDARQRIVSLLEKQTQRIIVVIDDLDRLTPKELVAMAQAVKAVADFPNVIHLLAYDPKTAAAAASEEFGLPGDGGRRYWEKIIQIPLIVPEVPAFKIQNFASCTFSDCIRKHLNLKSDHNNLDATLPIAAALMDTPRDVLRLKPILEIVMPHLAGNVDLADVLLAEALRMKTPDLIAYVDRNRWAFLERGRERWDAHSDQRGEFQDESTTYLEPEGSKERKEQILNEWRKCIPEVKNLGRFTTAMSKLFNAVKDWSQPTNDRTLPLQRYSHWIRWKAVVRHEDTLEVSDIHEWLKHPNKLMTSSILGDQERFADFCSLVADYVQGAPEVDVTGTVNAFIHAAQLIGDDAFEFDPSDYRYGYGPREALVAVLRTAAPADRARPVQEWVSKVSPWTSYDVLRIAKSDLMGIRGKLPENPQSPLIADRPTLENLLADWLDKAWPTLRESAIPNGEKTAYRMAAWISHLGGQEEDIKAALTELLNQPDGLEIVFGSSAFSEGIIENVGVENAPWLPDRQTCLDALARKPSFEDNHPQLVGHWKSSGASDTPT